MDHRLHPVPKATHWCARSQFQGYCPVSHGLIWLDPLICQLAILAIYNPRSVNTYSKSSPEVGYFVLIRVEIFPKIQRFRLFSIIR